VDKAATSNITYVIEAMIMLLIIVFCLSYKIEKKPDIKWDEKLTYNSEATGGLALFTNLIKSKYGSDNCSFERSDSLEILAEKENSLLIHFSKNLPITGKRISNLLEFIENGNDAILFIEDGYLGHQEFPTIDSSLNYYYQDSIIVNWEDDLNFSFKNVNLDLYELSKTNFYYIPDSLSSYIKYSYKDLATNEQGKAIFRSIDFDSSTLFVHTIPKLYTNIASEQDFYLQNLNNTFKDISRTNVIFHTFNLDSDETKESPLQFILSQRSLRTGYYLLLFTTLLYILFGSKRKQRIIPVVKPKVNTSKEYVSIASALFEAQNQNRKLAPHMENIFNNKMKKKYFLNSNAKDYNIQLQRKSRVSQAIIDRILNKFRLANSKQFTNEELINLYQEIDNFYKICK